LENGNDGIPIKNRFMKKWLLLINSLLVAIPIWTQKPGLIVDEAAYKKLLNRSKMRGNFSESGTIADQTFSLKKYCPKPDKQTNASCVGWALGYAGMTILQARHQGITYDDVNELTHSPSFIYNKIAESDESGASIEKGLRWLQESGICRSLTYSNHAKHGMRFSERAMEEAPHFKISDYGACFDPDTNRIAQIFALKRKLIDKGPIIVSIKTNSNFIVQGDTSLSDAHRDTIYHAMCLIGFDDKDNTFELMNSWGSQWGTSGFIRVRQAQLMAWLNGAYWIELPKSTGNTKIYELLLRREPEKEKQLVSVHFQPNLFPNYKTQKESFDMNQKFEFDFRDLRQGQYIYLFECAPNRQWKILDSFEVKSNSVSYLMSYKCDSVGEQYICVLFTPNRLANFQSRFEKMINSKGTVQAQIQAGFGDLKPPKQFWTYSIAAEVKMNQPVLLSFILKVF
jgi:hypothetical protein